MKHQRITGQIGANRRTVSAKAVHAAARGQPSYPEPTGAAGLVEHALDALRRHADIGRRIEHPGRFFAASSSRLIAAATADIGCIGCIGCSACAWLMRLLHRLTDEGHVVAKRGRRYRYRRSRAALR